MVVRRYSSARAGSWGAGSAGSTGDDDDSPSSAVELLEKGEDDLGGAGCRARAALTPLRASALGGDNVVDGYVLKEA